MSISLTLLGTGTPSPLVHRGGSSYLVRLDDQMLLFDCGPACVRRLLRKGICPTKIDTLFLTHLHYDHFVDYAYLVLVRWDQSVGKIPDLNVYGPSPAQRVSDRLFDEDGAFGPDLAARTEHPGSHFIYEMRGGVLPRERPRPRLTEVANGSQITLAGHHGRGRPCPDAAHVPGVPIRGRRQVHRIRPRHLAHRVADAPGTRRGRAAAHVPFRQRRSR
jgi:ribonuclease Z